MRLIDADKFAEDICNFLAIDEHSANAVIFLLHEQPTVDIKTDVAREIFEEIEKHLKKELREAKEHTQVYRGTESFVMAKRTYFLEDVLRNLTELKNKHKINSATLDCQDETSRSGC